MSRFTKVFWIDLAERAIATFCESALAMLTVGQAVTDVDWVSIVSVSAVSTLISVLKSVVVAIGKGDQTA